ncbi:hypothetical protein PM082_022305 [Marasmius tenuissimus]|nr:hypothetical protein PM082_022305 [Marasmius tenuissimus]
MQRVPVSGDSPSSPFSRVPVELLQHIFSLSTDVKITIGKRIESMPTATVLSLVCRHWRDVALGSPTLWSTLEFNIDTCSKNGRNGDRALAITEGLLKKSHREPLAISFKGDPDVNYSATSDFRFLEALCLHLYRWSTISLSIGLSFTQLPAFLAVKGRLSSLRTVQFTPYDDNVFCQIDMVQESFFALGPFPALRHIEAMDRENSDFPTGPLPAVPWARLKSLTLSNTSFLPRILPLCRSLISLTFTVWDHDFILELRQGWQVEEEYLQDLKDMRAFTLPKLQSLTIENRGSDALSILFNKVTAPALTAIHFDALRYKVELTEGGLIALLDCLDRSSCSITSLYLGEGLMDHGQVIRLLEHLPGLTTLGLREFYSDYSYRASDWEGKLCTPGLFDRFTTRTNSTPPLLPSLRHLDISLHGKTFLARKFIPFVQWWLRRRPSDSSGVSARNGTRFLKFTFWDRNVDFVPSSGWFELIRIDGRIEVYLRDCNGPLCFLVPIHLDVVLPHRRCNSVARVVVDFLHCWPYITSGSLSSFFGGLLELCFSSYVRQSPMSLTPRQ